MSKPFYLISLLLLLIYACNTKETKESQSALDSTQKISKTVSVIEVVSPKAGDLFTIGDKININIALKETDVTIDSLVAETEHQRNQIKKDELTFVWNTDKLKTGNNQLRIYAFSNGQQVETYYLKLRFKSDIVPEALECKIVKTYPHDIKSYTQGLIFEDGIMYEGTGQYGQSVLRKIDFETGKIIAELSIPAQYFGEGITAFGDKIIQLTWTSKVGFVYDKNSFKLITTLQYNTQGWGLTTDGKRLIMSDGSSTIYFLDPEYFTQNGSIEVFDNEGPVKKLNELEYINGLVYANVYQTEEIIAFDPITGKVMKRIDCRKIVPDGFRGDEDNVLNGIAYDTKTGRIFITGKRWPKLFEVTFK
jgi:glutaminyl-peptide cyclotransferase